MSRFLYDVDKTTRYIDVHKQFQGGLKTVDTDDSLKDVYLREAENVSLSEFNFIEKRHGTHKLAEHKPWSSVENAASKLQGYFEYYVNATTVHKIIAFEGRFYIDQGAGFQEVTLFDTPNGEFIDLSSLGVYPIDNITLSWSSISPFGNQTPWYSQNNPNGVISGSSGQYIHASNGQVYVNTGGTGWTPIAGATFPFVSNLINGKYYLDTRTNKIYKWNNATGWTGQFTFVTSIYSADFQTTRPIEGVRIDDKLYIATGTYPVYYKGDGKIYVLPQYDHSDLDLQNLGYNLNSVDLDSEFNNVQTLTKTSSQGTTLDGITLEVADVVIKEIVKYPKIPYQLEGGKVTFNTAWHLFNRFDYGSSANLSYWRYGPSYTFLGVTYGKNAFAEDFNPGGLTGDYQPWGSFTSSGTPAYYNITRQTNHLELRCILYRKPAGTVDSLYESVVDRLIYTNNNASSGTLLYPTAPLFPTSSGATISNQEIVHNNPTSGFWDYKLQFVVRERTLRYLKNTDGSDNRYAEPQVIAVDIPKGYIEYKDIWVTPEELTDYKEEPFLSLKVHSCNRITEHNGRLALFGSTTHPDYVFFSTSGAREYFPYGYSIQFTNELSEGVNVITKFMNILVVQSNSYTWGIKGDSPLPVSALEGDVYRKLTINPTIGCIAPYSVKNVRNQLYFLSKEGIFTLRALYAEDNRYNVDPIDRNIVNIVPRDVTAKAAYFDDQYWITFSSGETLRYYVDKKAWVKDTFTAMNSFGGIFKYINESGSLRFITELSQLEDDEALKVFDIEVDYSLPSDLGNFFVSKVTTSFLNQNYPFHFKNYKEAKFDYTIQNEYNIGKEPIYAIAGSYGEGGTSPTQYILFNTNLTKRHFYQITLDKVNVPTSYSYIVYVNNIARKSGTFTNTNPVSQSWLPIEFQILDTDTMPCQIKIVSQGLVLGSIDSSVAVLKDSTYDNSITFTNIVLSEEGTLNIDPIESYSQPTIEKVINLGTRLGNWAFGTSDFGNIITAVETIKLAGKGYNCKISITETGKSKWTLESLGITYKMKKARSR